jgi:hypothetical protein
VSGHLVGSTAFKAAGTGDPRPAGSIPVHLRHRSSGVLHGDAFGTSPAPPPAPLLPCSDVKKLIVLLAVLGIAVLAAKKIRST